MTPRAGTAVTSERSLWALAGPPLTRSTVGNGDMRVEIGFIATRQTTGSPVVMPPSSPPALLLRRRKPPRASPGVGGASPAGAIGSWAPEPGRGGGPEASPAPPPLSAGKGQERPAGGRAPPRAPPPV